MALCSHLGEKIMASLSTDANGNRTIQFIGRDKKRRSIRLGSVRE